MGIFVGLLRPSCCEHQRCNVVNRSLPAEYDGPRIYNPLMHYIIPPAYVGIEVPKLEYENSRITRSIVAFLTRSSNILAFDRRDYPSYSTPLTEHISSTNQEFHSPSE